MKKRILSGCIVLCMLLSLIPMQPPAFAEGEGATVHSHCACGGSAQQSGHEHAPVVYQTLTMGENFIAIDGVEQESNALPAGNYYLPDDMVIDGDTPIRIGAEQTVNLCLNGCEFATDNLTPEGQESDYDATAFRLESKAALTLSDCAGGGKICTKTGRLNGIVGGKITMWGGEIATTKDGYGFRLRDDKSLDLYGGVISGAGRAIYAYGAGVNIYGGRIDLSGDGCTGVECYSGTLNIYGGLISAEGYRAVGVVGDGNTLTVSGGTILGAIPINLWSGKLILSGKPVIGPGEEAELKVEASDAGVINGSAYEGEPLRIICSYRNVDDLAVSGVTDLSRFSLIDDGYRLEYSEEADGLVYKGKWYLPEDQDGTEGAPYTYHISSVTDLVNLRMLVNNSIDDSLYNSSDVTYLLTDNIDLSSECGSALGNWKPIGGNYGFQAVLDGNNRSITGLYINNATDKAGLFDSISEGTVKNLSLSGSVSCEIRFYDDGSGYECYPVGLLTGEISGDATFTNCTLTGTVTGGLGYTGPIYGSINYGNIDMTGMDTSGVRATYLDFDLGTKGLMAHTKPEFICYNTCDVRGMYNDAWISTTFSDDGYYVMTNDAMETATVTAAVKYTNGERYVELSYTVTAGPDGVQDGGLAVGADVQIGENDSATIQVVQDDEGKVVGLRMEDDNENYDSYGAEFRMYFDAVTGTAPASTYWFGYYGNYRKYAFDNIGAGTTGNNGDNYTIDESGLYTKLYGTDSGLAVSWQDIDLLPGESRTYSLLIGVGKAATPPKWPEEGDPLILAEDGSITARAVDEAGSLVTLYCSVDGESKEIASAVAGEDGIASLTGVVDYSGLAFGEHDLLFSLVNEDGAMCGTSLERTVYLHTHPSCGEACSHSSAHEGGRYMPFVLPAAQSAGSGALCHTLTSGRYYLTENVLAADNACILIPEGAEVFLCLNGFTITGATGETAISVKGELALCDCAENGAITGSSGENALIQSSGELAIHGGSLTATTGIAAVASAGALTVTGGSITATLGTAVSATGGTVSISGGASLSGGAYGLSALTVDSVSISGSASLTGGTAGVLFDRGNVHSALALTGGASLSGGTAGVVLASRLAAVNASGYTGTPTRIQAYVGANELLSARDGDVIVTGSVDTAKFAVINPGFLLTPDSNKLVYTPFQITQQPTAAAPTVAVNQTSGAAFQWYKATAYSLTDAKATGHTVSGDNSSYAGGLWTPVLGNDGEWYYFDISTVPGDVLYITFTGQIVPDAVSLTGAGSEQALLPQKDGSYMLVAGESGKCALHASFPLAAGTAPTATARFLRLGDALGDETGVTLRTEEDGFYACKVSYGDGTTLLSQPMDIHHHSYTYSASDASVEERCTCGHMETATLSLDPSADLSYTGSEICPAIVTYSGSWVGSKTAQITYRTNTDAGGGRAILTYNSVSATLDFTITPKPILAVWQNLLQIYDGTEKKPTVRLSGLVSGDECTAAVTGMRSAGVHSIQLTLEGAAAKNYLVTNPKANLTIQRAPVSFTLENTLQQYTGDGKYATVNPSASVSYCVDYVQNGEVFADPTQAGDYEVWAEILDANYRHADGVDGTGKRIGTLSIYRQAAPATYAASFTGGDEAQGAAPASLQGLLPGTVIALPAVGELTRTDHVFSGWLSAGKVYQPGESYTMPAANVSFTAQWQPTYEITGYVKQGTVSLPDVTVTLMLGAEKIDETVSDENGSYAFSSVLPGIYNLVASRNGVVMTVKIEIVNSDGQADDILLPEGKTNSVVDVEPGTPPVVVGNLEKVFGASEIYSEDDRQTVEDGGKVEICLYVSPAQMSPDEEAAITEEIGMALSIVVKKTVEDSDGNRLGDRSTTLNDTVILLEHQIVLPPELQGKDSYTIYRFHDGQLHTLSTTPNNSGEYIVINEEKTAITIFAQLYSTYIVSYSVGGEAAPTRKAAPTVELEVYGQGGATIRPYPPVQGTVVTVYPEPEEGYALTLIEVMGPGGPVEVVPNEDGSYTYIQPGGKAVISLHFDRILAAWNPFEDVLESHWFHDSVRYAYEHGLVIGTGATMFSPELDTSRGMIAIILWRVEGEPEPASPSPYLDVSFEDSYGKAVAWADAQGLVEGYGDGRYGPNDSITREQLAAIFWRYARYKGLDTRAVAQLTGYPDCGFISGYALIPMSWACENKLIIGTDKGLLDPRGNASRAQLVTILERFFSGMEE